MMEGPLEIKNSSANVEEPIKSEALVQNSDSNERNDGATSPPPNCSICLGKLVNTSFTDSCLHQFCFTCLLQWSKIKTECPLCKQKFKSIINNVRSEEDYDQYHVPRKLASQVPEPHVTATLDVNFDLDNNVAPWGIVPRRFLYRTTMTGNRQSGGSFLNPEQIVRREQLPSMASQVPREERIRRRANPTDYRRTIYRHGIWATAVPDVSGRFHELNSAEYYRRRPQGLDRLVPWLNRELQVLLNNEPSHCAYVLSVIMDALTQFDIRSGQFRDTVRPFFTIHTNHFAHELFNFAQTNFDLVGYDQFVTYLPRGLSNEYARIVSPTPSSTSSSSSSSITSDNSDVRILDEAIDLRVNTEMPSTISHPISMPGPSTAGSTLPRVETSYYDPELLILSSSSSSDGECEIIGYVKPRHERTPEIIELLSSESEHATVPHTSNENTQSRKVYPENLSLPSTSHGTKESSSVTSCSSTSSDTNSDSDYNPRQSKQNCSRKLSEKKFIQSVIQKYRNKRSTRSRNKRSKKRIFTSSDTNLSEVSVKNNEKRSKKTRYKVQTKGTGRIKLIKREQSYSDDDSSSSDSSSEESDSKIKINKCRRSYRSKRKHSSPVNDYTSKSGNTTKGKGKASVLEKLRSRNKDQKYCESKQSRSRSSSESSDASKHDKRSSYQESRVRYQESRDTSEYESQDDSASIKKDMSKKEYKAKSKKKIRYSSDSEDDHLSSSSQCSNHSNKSYTYRKKSKRREKHKEKEHHRSNSRAFNSSQSNASTTLTISVSSKNDMHPSKHSDKEKRKSYKVSKRRKPENEKKSRPKKKRRRLRSSSISNSA